VTQILALTMGLFFPLLLQLVVCRPVMNLVNYFSLWFSKLCDIVRRFHRSFSQIPNCGDAPTETTQTANHTVLI